MIQVRSRLYPQPPLEIRPDRHTIGLYVHSYHASSCFRGGKEKDI